jgi:hypothetical protein
MPEHFPHFSWTTIFHISIIHKHMLLQCETRSISTQETKNLRLLNAQIKYSSSSNTRLRSYEWASTERISSLHIGCSAIY